MKPSDKSKPVCRDGRYAVRGEIIEQERIRQHLTRDQLRILAGKEEDGEKIEMAVNTLKKAINGGPSYLSTIARIAKALKLEPSVLVDLPELPEASELALIERKQEASVAEQQPESVAVPPLPRETEATFKLSLSGNPEAAEKQLSAAEITLRKFNKGMDVMIRSHVPKVAILSLVNPLLGAAYVAYATGKILEKNDEL